MCGSAGPTNLSSDESFDKSPHSKALRADSERAALTLQRVMQQDWLLDVVLDHLALGCATLYEAILNEFEISNLTCDIEKAGADLIHASVQYQIPGSLLTCDLSKVELST